MTVADTDVLIDFMAGVEPAASRVSTDIKTGSLLTTAISRFELLSGARNARAQAAVCELLAVLPCLPLDDQAADRAAEVRRALDASGQAIGMADSLIAGVVLSRGATLLTRNRRHFQRVAGLRLADIGD